MKSWTPYPRRLVQGSFVEDLDLIIELIGTHLYEWCEDAHGKVWIRRSPDCHVYGPLDERQDTDLYHVTQKEIELLIQHYTFEVNRWTDESPGMLGEAKANLAYWKQDAAKGKS